VFKVPVFREGRTLSREATPSSQDQLGQALGTLAEDWSGTEGFLGLGHTLASVPQTFIWFSWETGEHRPHLLSLEGPSLEAT
jgi:hypothetical protein